MYVIGNEAQLVLKAKLRQTSYIDRFSSAVINLGPVTIKHKIYRRPRPQFDDCRRRERIYIALFLVFLL